MPALPWIDAWQTALYGDGGFYRRDEGPAGHFATSAQGIPGVNEILAQAITARAAEIGAEVIVDFASGRGELLVLLAAHAADDVALVGVDVVGRPDDLPRRASWLTSPGGPRVPALDVLAGRRALVVAHEWLDVVPCPVLEADDTGTWREVLVDRRGVETPGRERTEAWPPGEPGERRELGGPRDTAWANLLVEVRRHAAPGSVALGIDYTITADSPPPFGTLTGFRGGSECAPVPDGSCDITSHVVLDHLDVDTVCTQREALLGLFGEDLLAPVPVDLAHHDPQGYLQRLAARSAYATAVHPDGLGAFSWFSRTLE